MAAQIPSDIVREILLRLPAESLLRFRAVCREWCNIIDDKSFVLSHSIRSQLPSSTLLIGIRRGNLLYSISIDSLIKCADLHDRGKIAATWVQDFGCSGLPGIYGFPLLSCNGLILLHPIEVEEEKKGVILNPVTRKFHELPPPPEIPGFVKYRFIGFGYDSFSDDYKIITVCRRWDRRADDPYSSFVYSMKNNSWRKIADVDPGDISFSHGGGVFFNGFVYWKSRINYVLIRLDLATELYDKVPVPNIDHGLWFCDIGLLDGSLCVSLYYTEYWRWLEVWEMKDGGWMKLFSIGKSPFGCIRPIAYLKRKGLVLLTKWSSELYLFDIEKNSLRRCDIKGLPNEISFIMSFSGSLVQLNQSYDTRTRANARPGGSSRFRRRFLFILGAGWSSWFRRRLAAIDL